MTKASPTTRRPQAAGRALFVVLIALLLASLLNARSLVEVAGRQQAGFVRSVAVALAGAAERVSSALFLDEPREALDALLGRSRDRAERVVRAGPTPTTSVDDVQPFGTPPTRSDPVSAWIVGDSLVELFGPKLTDEFVASEVVEAEVDFRFITGLSRPDVFDWPAQIAARMRTDAPDIVVAMFGGNDGQPVRVDGENYVEYTASWWEIYRTRVAEAMDAMRSAKRAYWVGLPIMKDPEFRGHARQFNDVYRAEIATRPWMRFVSSWEVFTDEDGNYADYLPNHNGDLRLMRYADGAHFTPSGALKLALHVFEVIAEDIGIVLVAD